MSGLFSSTNITNIIFFGKYEIGFGYLKIKIFNIFKKNVRRSYTFPSVGFILVGLVLLNNPLIKSD